MSANFIVLETDPATGRAMPVSMETQAAESENFTTPPMVLTRPQRRRWLAIKRKSQKSMSPQGAYYEATNAIMRELSAL